MSSKSKLGLYSLRTSLSADFTRHHNNTEGNNSKGKEGREVKERGGDRREGEWRVEEGSSL